MVRDPDVDVVVEVIGGIEPAGELIVEALTTGKPVVTANKELLANFGKELFETAEAAGVDLLFEASVAGGVPLMRPLRESLAGDRISRVMGIVNGTTNYILTRMSEEGASFTDALAEAQSLGFAERDPTADVEGFDAAAKAAIIATIAFGARVVAGDVYREGISELTDADMASARRARLRREAARGRGRGCAWGRGPRAPHDDPVDPPARIRPRVVQRGLHRGRRGGRADVLRPRRRWRPHGECGPRRPHRRIEEPRRGRRGATIGALARKPVRPIDEVESQFYLQLEVADQPGVLAEIATQFGEHDVSIKSMQQMGIGADARIIFITHRAREADLRRTVHALRDVKSVHRVGSVLRVMGDEPG